MAYGYFFKRFWKWLDNHFLSFISHQFCCHGSLYFAKVSHTLGRTASEGEIFDCEGEHGWTTQFLIWWYSPSGQLDIISNRITGVLYLASVRPVGLNCAALLLLWLSSAVSLERANLKHLARPSWIAQWREIISWERKIRNTYLQKNFSSNWTWLILNESAFTQTLQKHFNLAH